MAVDLVVVNYHTPSLLDDCLKSYFTHRFEGCTLTVIDVETSMRDAVAGAVADSYSAFPDNIGYGRACNVGALSGTNDVICFANADTQLSEGFQACYEALIAKPEWAILGPKQVDERGRITAGGIIGDNRHMQQRCWLYPNQPSVAATIDEDVPSVAGSIFFIKRAIWDQLTSCEIFQAFQPGSLGAFLETPHYYEETWCCFHARAHGYRCVYYGPVTMVHLWHRSSPHDGPADRAMPFSRHVFRQACALHSIECE